MTKLEGILAQYEVTGELGGEAKQFDRDYLRLALAGANRQTAVAFWLAAAAQMGVFLMAATLVIANSGNPKAISGILAAAGGSVGACAWAMVRLWKEKVSTDLTLALVSSLNESAARSVLSVVLDTLRKSNGSAARRKSAAKDASGSRA